MVTDHIGVNKSAVDLVIKLKVPPQNNSTAQRLKAGGDENLRNLRSLADGGRFDSQAIEPGRSWTFTPKKAGVASYRCSYHSTMKGTLRIE
jgi:plastocyanin